MKKKRTTRAIILCLVLAAALVLTACNKNTQQTSNPEQPTTTPPSASQPGQGGTPTAPAAEPTVLRARIRGDIKNLDPCHVTGPNDEHVVRQVYEGLIRFKPGTSDIQLMVAEKFEILNDLEIYFKLREGVQFQRGYGEVTAEDVKWTYERFIDPATASAYKSDWGSLDHVEVISKYEGKIVLSEPLGALMTNTLPYSSGMIQCRKHFEAVGADKYAFDPVGCGPYEFVKWIPNERTEMKRYPGYWGAQCYYDEIHIIPIGDDTVAEVALQAGDIDYSQISLTSMDRFDGKNGYKVSVYNGARYAWVGMNMENPKLENLNVRLAIRYGIDVQSILDAAYDGIAPWARAAIPEGRVGYWADAPKYERDVAKAKDYMAKAGITTLDLELAIENTLEWRTWAEIIQQNLAEVGINIKINAMEGGAFWSIGEGDKGKEVELFCMSYSAAGEPSWYTQWFTKEQIGEWNWMRWSSSEFDELHQQGMVTIDPAKRTPIYIEAQKVWDKACNAVWVTHTVHVFAHKDNIDTLFMQGSPIPVLRDFKAK